MKPEEVPDALVDLAYPVCLAHDIPWHDDAVKLILAAVLPGIATRFEEHLLAIASGYEEIAYDGGMPGASKTGAGSPRALRADARFLRELAKDTSWITGGDR